MSSTGGTGFGNLTFATVADFDNDGKLDVIANNSGWSSGQLLYSFAGNGTFAAVGTLVALGAQPDFPNTAVAGDFNGDGRADLAMATGLSALEYRLGPGSAVHVRFRWRQSYKNRDR